MKHIDRWLEEVGQRALSSRQTLRATYDLARNVIERGIPGDFVECGVFSGAQCAAMARAIMDAYCIGNGRALASATPRRVHLFDSFEGIPAPTEHDVEWIAARHPVGTSACALEIVKGYMEQWKIPQELLVYHPGPFDQMIPDARRNNIGQIALLRLDGDLYESTKVCADYLYLLVSPGGWIVLDDFNLSGARKAFLESVGGEGPGPAYFQRHG